MWEAYVLSTSTYYIHIYFHLINSLLHIFFFHYFVYSQTLNFFHSYEAQTDNTAPTKTTGLMKKNKSKKKKKNGGTVKKSPLAIRHLLFLCFIVKTYTYSYFSIHLFIFYNYSSARRKHYAIIKNFLNNIKCLLNNLHWIDFILI